jgi:hypothetical protein
MNSGRTRIQQFLVETCRAGEFYKVTYANAIPNAITRAPENVFPPVSVLANETQSRFSRDENYGRGLKLIRDEWLFEVIVNWSEEATLEYFEQALLETPPILARDSNFPQVILELTDARYEHPTQQQPTNGTKAVLTFKATVGRS